MNEMNELNPDDQDTGEFKAFQSSPAKEIKGANTFAELYAALRATGPIQTSVEMVQPEQYIVKIQEMIEIVETAIAQDNREGLLPFKNGTHLIFTQFTSVHSLRPKVKQLFCEFIQEKTK